MSNNNKQLNILKTINNNIMKKIIQRIKDFFICVKLTWICRLYLVIGLLVITSTYVGQRIEHVFEFNRLDNLAIWVMLASMSYLAIFTLYMLFRAFYNILRKNK